MHATNLEAPFQNLEAPAFWFWHGRWHLDSLLPQLIDKS